MMYRLLPSVTTVCTLMLGTCLAIPIPINTTALNNDTSVNYKPSTTTNGEYSIKLDAQGDALKELEVQGNVVSSASDISKTLPRDELEKKIQTLISLLRNRVRSFPEERLKPESVNMDLDKLIYPTNVIESTGIIRPARERRSNGVTVNVNCSEHPDLCQQAIAWLQQHDKQVPTSLSHWQG